jgi:hypothetical protein
MPSQQRLHAVPRGAIDERLVLTGIPLATELDLTDIRPVLQNIVNRASWKPRRRGAKFPALIGQLFDERVERMVLVCEQVKDAPHIGGGNGIDFD